MAAIHKRQWFQRASQRDVERLFFGDGMVREGGRDQRFALVSTSTSGPFYSEKLFERTH